MTELQQPSDMRMQPVRNVAVISPFMPCCAATTTMEAAAVLRLGSGSTPAMISPETRPRPSFFAVYSMASKKAP